ncbi:RDD family protein [Cloacibacterium sp.]|uniref:RDD family protein n=1 Tax=Cloacibacterium sp. TaxID=1913682 RepID=UPI0035ADB7CA
MSRIQIVERNKASLGLRFVNNLIDSIILNWVPTLLLYFFGQIIFYVGYEDLYNLLVNFTEDNFVLNILISVLITVFYYYLMEFYNNGRTIGKYITGTMAVSLSGEMSSIQIWKRTLSRLVPFDALSFFGENGWHDSWSDTRVVKISDFENAMRMENELENIGKE